MSSAPHAQAPSPAIVFETLNAYQRTAALRAAIELDVFTAIGEGNKSVETIAKRIHASEKGTRVLCDYLTIGGLLAKENGNYDLTADTGVFLNKHSPAYIGGMVGFISNPKLVAQFDDLAAVVRKGGCLAEEGTVEPDNPIWVDFANSMAPMMHMPADLISKMVVAASPGDCKVLDIAAGHGLFGIAVAAQNPKAHIAAVDWAAVLAVAQQNADKAGVGGRYSKIPGSAFDVDYGTGYNAVLITNFLHHFDIPTNEALLKKIYAAMAPGGVVVTLEFIPNEDRISPPIHASFSMMMLGSTPSGDAYTFSEYDKMFGNAGFQRNELRELTPLPQRVIVSYK